MGDAQHPNTVNALNFMNGDGTWHGSSADAYPQIYPSTFGCYWQPHYVGIEEHNYG